MKGPRTRNTFFLVYCVALHRSYTLSFSCLRHAIFSNNGENFIATYCVLFHVRSWFSKIFVSKLPAYLKVYALYTQSRCGLFQNLFVNKLVQYGCVRKRSNSAVFARIVSFSSEYTFVQRVIKKSSGVENFYWRRYWDI